jgi:hypothetical protein
MALRESRHGGRLEEMLLSSRVGPELRWSALPTLIVLLVALSSPPTQACVGSGCLQIWSTADGGGALTVQWDFANKAQTYESFCAPDKSSCLYSNIDPGFMAPTDAVAGSGYYRLLDGTTVTVQVVSADAGLSMNVNGQKLYQPGDSALLGTMPTIHVHPSWQIVVPGDQFGDFQISFQLNTDSAAYTDSQVFTLVVTNVQPTAGSATPTPTATPQPTPCDGDCNSDGAVTVNELVVCVNMALGTSDACHACDANGDGTVTINEIIAAVNAALNGCPALPTVTLAQIQDTIFTPSCATVGCHSGASPTGSLSLEGGQSYAQLVNVAPLVPLAAQAGELRVDPGHPENSFLLVKVSGTPPPGEGSPMPLTGNALTPAEVEMIRDWILEGANP